MASTITLYDLKKRKIGTAQVEHDGEGLWIDQNRAGKPHRLGDGWISFDMIWSNRATGTQHRPVLIREEDW